MADVGEGYPAVGKPLAPRPLGVLLSDAPRDPIAAALADHLADFDSMTSARLPAVSRASVAAQVRACITNAWGWLDFAEYRPYRSTEPVPIDRLHLSPATEEVL